MNVLKNKFHAINGWIDQLSNATRLLLFTMYAVSMPCLVLAGMLFRHAGVVFVGLGMLYFMCFLSMLRTTPNEDEYVNFKMLFAAVIISGCAMYMLTH